MNYDNVERTIADMLSAICCPSLCVSKLPDILIKPQQQQQLTIAAKLYGSVQI